MRIRRVRESDISQGEDEKIAYQLTTTPWGSNPSDVSVKLYSLDDYGVKTDVSSTKLVGGISVSGDVITTPSVTGLVAGTRYRMEIKFTIAGNVFEAWCGIVGEV